MRLILAIVAGLVGGCTLVYDSQYDDRATELEAFRREIFPVESGVKLLASGGDLLYWVDFLRPGDENVLHSIRPPDRAATDYTWSEGDGDSTILDYRFGEQIVIRCNSSAIAFTAGAANTERGRTTNGSDRCAVDGTTVYFLVGDRMDRWVPAGTPPSPEPDLAIVVDFTQTDIRGSVDTFGVIGNLAVVTESGGDIYTVDLATRIATWLENEAQVISSSVIFDDKGVLFDTNGDGTRYIQFQDRVETEFKVMVADGGYHMSFKHADIHEPAESSEFVIHGRHVIYRSKRGIFAYGLDTRNVIDLLLDRGEGLDLEVEYHNPTVTSGGFLYVQSRVGFEDGPVYEVDLAGRLR